MKSIATMKKTVPSYFFSYYGSLHTVDISQRASPAGQDQGFSATKTRTNRYFVLY